MIEPDRLFKCYCNEYNTAFKVEKHNKYKNARNLVIFKTEKPKRILPELFSKAFKKCSKAFKSIK